MNSNLVTYLASMSRLVSLIALVLFSLLVPVRAVEVMRWQIANSGKFPVLVSVEYDTYTDAEHTELSGVFTAEATIPAGGSHTFIATDEDITFSPYNGDVVMRYLSEYELVGNSYIATGEPTWVLYMSGFDWAMSSVNSGDAGDLQPPPNPPVYKSLWVLDDSPTGALNNQVYREGVDKMVWTLKESLAASGGSGGGAIPDLPDSVPLETYTITGLTDVATAMDGVTESINTKFADLIASPPSFFSGEAGASESISLTFPGITVMGSHTDDVEIVIDPTTYSTPITFIRTLLLALLHIAFFFSFIELVKSAVTDAKTYYWLSNASDSK